ncbi:MAG: RNA 2',3'-cyclic phosphodiesterase [Myxococcales bacterium]|nr:RNA 2',3'-cyclic phosphodiesterase [Myxococcales bacterium]
MSLFLALALPDVVRSHVADVIEHGRATPGLNARWLRPERLHVTVLFLGRPLDPATLAARMPDLAARHAPIQLGVKGAGLFTTPRAPSVLWLGLHGDLGGLMALRADALRVFADAVDPLEVGRHFQPHVTLARGKRPGELDGMAARLSELTVPKVALDSLHLYESGGDAFTSHRAESLMTPIVGAP